MPRYLLVLGEYGLRIPQRIDYRESLRVTRLLALLRERGFEPLLTHYEDPCLWDTIRDLKIRWCVPATSWLVGYRELVHSVVVALLRLGVSFIPSVEHVLAYENKLLQASVARALRLATPLSFPVSTVEGLHRAVEELGYPCVVKRPDGFRSSNVQLIEDRRALTRVVEEQFTDGQEARGTRGIGSLVVQQFLPGLAGDWKVILVGKAAASLYREVRPHDFRASGSGRFRFERAPDAVFGFAEEIRRTLEAPWVSCDIAEHHGRLYLLEYQVVHFGTRTIDMTPKHVQREGTEWVDHSGPVDFELHCAEGIAEAIERGSRGPADL